MDYNDKMGQYTCENNGLIFAWDDAFDQLQYFSIDG